MGRHWTVVALVTALVLGAVARLAVAQDRTGPARRVHELTAEKNGAIVRVRLGDALILKLPMQMPFTWGLLGETAVLREVKQPLKLQPVQEASNEGQVVGAPQLCALHYDVVAEPKDETLQWVYCYLGQTKNRGVPVEPTEPLKPGELPTKKGIYFRVRLLPEG